MNTRVISDSLPEALTQSVASSAGQAKPKRLASFSRERYAKEPRSLDERTPVYMGLITLSSALAAVTQLWAGVVTFGLVVLVFEGLNRWISRLTR